MAEAWNPPSSASTDDEPRTIVVVTASNEKQAAAVEVELRHRRQAGTYGENTAFFAVPDPSSARVGSGGATFNALITVQELVSSSARWNIEQCRVFMIHSGGDSQRLPCQSVCGKAWSSLPTFNAELELDAPIDLLLKAMFSLFRGVRTGLVVASSDVLLLHLPSGIGSVSLVPGLEGDWDVASTWRLTPYVKAGFTKTSGRQSNVASFGLGLRSDLLRPGALRNADGQVVPRAFEYTFHQELNLAVADMRGTAPSDQFLRWRNGVEIDRDTGLTWHNRQLRIAPFALLDTYLDPPLSILTGRKADRWQGEVGFSVGLSPAPQLLGAAVPALGFSYRIAGELSGWHLAIGRPF